MTTSTTRRGRPANSLIFAQFAASTKKLAEYGGLPNLEQAGVIWDDIWYVEAID
jgi:hypothetical protein